MIIVQNQALLSDKSGISALALHLIAGQNEIKADDEKRRERGPFLDRRAVGKSRDQGEEGADDEKYHAGNHRHVIAGHREKRPHAKDVRMSWAFPLNLLPS
jgi:hypothetical protein